MLLSGLHFSIYMLNLRISWIFLVKKCICIIVFKKLMIVVSIFCIHICVCFIDSRPVLSLLCQIALFNTALSVKNFKAAMEVPAALGLDPKIANSGEAF